MGSNEAGEQRAGKEETLPRIPDGLIHPPCTCVHSYVQVRTRGYSATACNLTVHARCVQWRRKVGAALVCERVQWVADKEEKEER